MTDHRHHQTRATLPLGRLRRIGIFCLPAVTALAIAASTQASAKAATSNTSEPPRVLLLDTAPIWTRYIASDADPHDVERRKFILTAEMQPVLRRFAAKAGAAIVLDKQSLLASSPSAEIDPRAVMLDLDKDDAAINPAEPLPPSRDGEPMAASPTLLVVNRDFIAKTLQNEGVADVDGRLLSVLAQVRTDAQVSFLMNRAAVSMGLKGADGTMMVLDRMHGRQDLPLQPQSRLPMHFLTLDRERLLKTSKVGNSIQAQVGILVSQAEAEFRPRGDALRAQGEALKAKLTSLQPQEQQKEVDAFEVLEHALQSDVTARQKKIEDAVLVSRLKIEEVVGPIASALMARRGDEFLLDSNAVLLAPDGADITADCISQLDAKMPSVKLELAP